MSDKIDPPAKQVARTDNTLGIDDLSTQPSSVQKSPDAKLPIEFGRYRLLKQLGEGGMGVVYLAHDIELDRQVALKLPHFTGAKSKDLAERFRREARLAATLDHPNICRIYDIGEHQRRLFLTMAYVEGRTLHEIIRSKGAIQPRTAVALLRRIAQAVHVAHGRGVIHRDLKPANIMIKKDRDFVIMDFGLARRVEHEEAQLTATGAVLGTPAYMAPEQLRGEKGASGPPSDVYSLGIILFELLTGQRPFQGTLPQIYAQVLTTDSVSPSQVRAGIEPELDAICQKATHRDAAQRYQSAEEFSVALGRYLNGDSEPADATQFPVRQQQSKFERAPSARAGFPPRRRNPTMLIAAGGAALFAMLLSVIVILVRNKDGSTTELHLPDGALAVEVQKDDRTIVTLDVAGAGSGSGDAEVATAKAEAEAARTEASAAKAELEKFRSNPLSQRESKLSREQAIANIEKLGGTIEYQNASKDGPVSAIRLENDRFTDDDLANLEPLNDALVVKIVSSAITDAGLRHLKGLTRIQNMVLQSGQIDGSGFDSLLGLKNLDSLTLTGTRVGDLSLASLLQRMKEFKELNLSGCPITDTVMEHLKGLPKLENLDLTGTQVTDKGLKLFGASPTITSLHLNGLQITGDGLRCLWGANRLTFLSLGETKVDDEGLQSLTGLPSIHILYLHSTPISDAGLVHLKSLSALRWLLLRGTLVTDAGLEHLKGLPSLQILFVQNSKITEAGGKKLQESLPDLKIAL